MKLDIDIKELKKRVLMQITSDIFTASQENIAYKKWRIETKFGVIEEILSDTGNLLKSGNMNVYGDRAEIVYSSPYASSIEFGRPAGKYPPVKPIMRWVSRKLGLSGKKGKQVAYAIVQKIYKEGTQPRPFLRKAIEEVRKKYK